MDPSHHIPSRPIVSNGNPRNDHQKGGATVSRAGSRFDQPSVPRLEHMPFPQPPSFTSTSPTSGKSTAINSNPSTWDVDFDFKGSASPQTLDLGFDLKNLPPQQQQPERQKTLYDTHSQGYRLDQTGYHHPGPRAGGSNSSGSDGGDRNGGMNMATTSSFATTMQNSKSSGRIPNNPSTSPSSKCSEDSEDYSLETIRIIQSGDSGSSSSNNNNSNINEIQHINNKQYPYQHQHQHQHQHQQQHQQQQWQRQPVSRSRRSSTSSLSSMASSTRSSIGAIRRRQDGPAVGGNVVGGKGTQSTASLTSDYNQRSRRAGGRRFLRDTFHGYRHYDPANYNMKRMGRLAQFNNERLYIHWIRFGVLQGGIAVMLLSFGLGVASYVGVAALILALLTLIYATTLYHKRHLHLVNKRKDVKYFAKTIPTLLTLGLIMVYAGNFVLTMKYGEDARSPPPWTANDPENYNHVF